MVFDSFSRHTLQTDSNTCGALACLNAYNIIPKTSYVCIEEELAYLRYWIASAIDTSEETVEMKKKKVYSSKN